MDVRHYGRLSHMTLTSKQGEINDPVVPTIENGVDGSDPTTGEASRIRSYDVIVIGAGVAGLAFTLSLLPEPRVALLTKGIIGESNTRYAQGGLSAAIGTEDS